ncbi:UDP-GlcNAc:undecaprenyl-phosphate GlcNAc-1-phosphate transferase [Treponema bryantii]|uniref:UDP-GlcNAc:undecaprenyl-phosphate GlcNAc-1-phosphate transferase n=1 Tax=Treponema bryantii TaxID=163 RepID=A0A1H9CTQ3_9SPIR|nr:MraY family glycosyltransferase [Treponema bryantii]SEQ04606.1 UDP-GlcNAc:undecaprenyl-phosphate GlcNAc-1-phosphate transferase [Treponema bryantii]
MSQSIYIALAGILSIISMPIILKICKKFSLYDYQNARKIHSGNIPRLGGVGIFLSFIIASVVFLSINDVSNLNKILPIMIAGTIVFIFAVLDDLLTLPALAKLIVQLIAVSVVVFNGFRFKQIFSWVLPTPVSLILTFGWILGVINAYNLIDGLDGLCGSFSISAIITLGVLYMLTGNPEFILCFILAAAVFGFLCFNWPPAKLFMGDAGSQFLGFMISVFPLFESNDVFEFNKFLIMIVITAFPVFDTIAAIWRRLRDKRPIMSPDRSHLHHKLLNMGYTKKSALYLLCFLQILLCTSVIISYFLGARRGMALLIESTAFVTLFFSFVHYTNRAIIIKQKKEALEEQKASENEDSEKTE